MPEENSRHFEPFRRVIIAIQNPKTHSRMGSESFLFFYKGEGGAPTI